MKTEKGTKILKYVADASVVVKWFADESDTAEAKMLLKQATEGAIVLFAPDLLIYEVGNVLWKGKQLDRKTIGESLEALWDSEISLEPTTKSLIKITVNFMATYNLTYYDAAYAALAFELGAPLVSSDARAHKNIKEISTLELKDLEN